MYSCKTTFISLAVDLICPASQNAPVLTSTSVYAKTPFHFYIWLGHLLFHGWSWEQGRDLFPTVTMPRDITLTFSFSLMGKSYIHSEYFSVWGSTYLHLNVCLFSHCYINPVPICLCYYSCVRQELSVENFF